ncbi:MAG: DMT family transporter [Candidatus Gastranaerophilales bacterium]|nr:DMT family transporter [Candidatus Gastranaerophilales bacterium]
MANNSNTKLYLLCNLSLLMAAMISGLSFVAQKIGMVYVGPLTFNLLRCFIGFLSLVPLLFLSGKFSEKSSIEYSTKALLKGGIFAGCILFIAFAINQYCMITAPAGKAGFITSLYIIFVPIIAIFMKQKLNKYVQFSIILSVIGLYLLCAKESIQVQTSDILLIISAFFFALHIIVVSYYSKRASSIKLSSLQFLVAGILFLPFAMLFENPTLTAVIAGYKPILFIGVIVTGVAYTLQIIGHKTTHPVLATLILSSEAIFAVFGGMLLLGETLSLKETIGCIIMIIAIVVSQLSPREKDISI